MAVSLVAQSRVSALCSDLNTAALFPPQNGGWMVPSAWLAMLHANEMVLPANISQGLQSMIASGGVGASGGGTTVSFNVSAVDSQSVAKFFQSNGNILVAAINRAMR